jgi:diacylglycerol kinase (ATP)
MEFDYVAAIYNPNSTGHAEKNARELQEVLRGKLPVAVSLIPTEYAGHAVELAYGIATTHSKPLIISASGDGGYNEVINGALRAQAEGAMPTCAVLPSGNANDHARNIHTKPLAELILEGAQTHLDVLKVAMRQNRSKQVRYAHSYVGLGLTSVVAVELNKNSLSAWNAWKETFIILKELARFRPVQIKRGDDIFEIDSLVCSTISSMAKLFTLSKRARADDGKFEVVTLPHDQKWKLMRQMVRGVVSEVGGHSRESAYSLELLEPVPMQYDGEVVLVEAGTKIDISICPRLLPTIAGTKSPVLSTPLDKGNHTKYQGDQTNRKRPRERAVSTRGA